jgi:hypothetical protein
MKRIIAPALIIIGSLFMSPTASAVNLPFTGEVSKGTCQAAAWLEPLLTDVKNLSQLSLGVISKIPGVGKIATLGSLAITGAGNISEAAYNYPHQNDGVEDSALIKLRDGIIGMNSAKDQAVEITTMLSEPSSVINSWKAAGVYEIPVDANKFSRQDLVEIFRNKIRPGATNLKTKAVQIVKVENVKGVLKVTKVFTAIGVVGDLLSAKETGSKIISTPKDILAGLKLCSLMK